MVYVGRTLKIIQFQPPAVGSVATYSLMSSFPSTGTDPQVCLWRPAFSKFFSQSVHISGIAHSTPGVVGVVCVDVTIHGLLFCRICLKHCLSAQLWNPYKTQGITEMLVRRDLWRFLAHHSAQSRTVASTWTGQQWLCLAKPWKHPRMETVQPLLVMHFGTVLLS